MAKKLLNKTRFCLQALFCCLSLPCLPSSSFALEHVQPIKAFHAYTWQLKNGVPVYFIPRSGLHFLNIQISFRAGSAYDQPKAYGLAYLTNSLLMMGAGDLSLEELTRQLQGVGAKVGNNLDRDMSSLTLQTLVVPSYLDKAVETFASMINHLSFPEAEVQRAKQTMATALKIQQNDLDNYAMQVFYQQIYGNHPYAHDRLGTASTQQALTRKDVVDFYQHFYVANNAYIAMAGSVSPAQAKVIAEKIAGMLPQKESAPALPTTPPLTANKTQYIDTPASQSHIFIGQDGITRKSRDMMAMRVANMLLGGQSFTSDLFRVLRNENGLAYTVFSTVYPLQYGGVFMSSLQTKNESVSQAIALTRQVIQNFYAAGPSQAQFAKTQQYMIDSFPISLYSNQALVANLMNVAFYHQDPQYLEKYPLMVAKLTRADILRAYRRMITPAKQVTVVVGGVKAQ